MAKECWDEGSNSTERKELWELRTRLDLEDRLPLLAGVRTCSVMSICQVVNCQFEEEDP